jgi:DNA-directed RNA polymerase subunit RPC12/RpoP
MTDAKDTWNHIALPVIPEPEPDTRSNLVTDSTDPEFIFVANDETSDSYDCGSCGRALMRGIRDDQVRNMVLKCPACGAFNEKA